MQSALLSTHVLRFCLMHPPKPATSLSLSSPTKCHLSGTISVTWLCPLLIGVILLSTFFESFQSVSLSSLTDLVSAIKPTNCPSYTVSARFLKFLLFAAWASSLSQMPSNMQWLGICMFDPLTPLYCPILGLSPTCLFCPSCFNPI